MNKAAVAVIGLLAVLAALFLFARRAQAPTAEEPRLPDTQAPAAEETMQRAEGEPSSTPNALEARTVPSATRAPVRGIPVPADVITYTDAGFNPASIVIRKGQTLRWMNAADTLVRPASAAHPSHAAYPQKSPSDCAGSSFDSCRGLSHGQAWDFTLEHTGSWSYHNHINPAHMGVVNVTE